MKLKLRRSRKIKKEKRETSKTSHSGKLLNPKNLSGLHHGEKADQAGILNVPQWQFPFWDRRWIYTLVEST